MQVCGRALQELQTDYDQRRLFGHKRLLNGGALIEYRVRKDKRHLIRTWFSFRNVNGIYKPMDMVLSNTKKKIFLDFVPNF